MDNNSARTPIRSFRDLEVYQNSYKGMLQVIQKIICDLPECEKYDLKDQLNRSSKAIPRLIAEGYAKRHQRLGFQKYIDDAMAECNETVVGLEQCLDLYGQYINKDLCRELIQLYEQCGRQLYRLRESWRSFPEKQ